MQIIYDSICKIERFVKGKNFSQFANDEMCTNAAIRMLEIIGEAAKNIPPAVKEKHPNVPWAEMARTRDKLIHAYSGVDNEIVWAIINNNLPQVKEEISGIIKKK